MPSETTTSLSLHYHLAPGTREAVLVELEACLERCATEPEFITAIVHETAERPNELMFYELWRGTRAEFDAVQGPKPYRVAYLQKVKQLLERVDVEWNTPILEWGTALTGRRRERSPSGAAARPPGSAPRPIELLMRENLSSVFGERDAARRRGVIAGLWAVDGIFIDPDGRHVGGAAVDAAVEQLLRRYPDFVFTERRSVEAFHGIGRLAWGFGPPGAPPVVTGLDVVVVADDRITTLYTFIDPPQKGAG